MKTRIIGAIVALVLAGIGAFVLIAYVRGADARAAEGAEMADVYIVAGGDPEGHCRRGVADFVKVDTVPQRNIAEGAVTDLDDLAGLVADADILPGEQLLEARFVDPAELAASGDVPVPEGMQLVSFTLPADRVVGGEIRAGDRIGMVGTVDPAEPSGARRGHQPHHPVRVQRGPGDPSAGRHVRGSATPSEPSRTRTRRRASC